MFWKNWKSSEISLNSSVTVEYSLQDNLLAFFDRLEARKSLNEESSVNGQTPWWDKPWTDFSQLLLSHQLNGGQEQQEAGGVLQAIPAASPGFQTLMMVNTSPIAVGDNAGASVIDLGDLDGTDGFSIEGVASNDYSGGSVSSAGDVNGDGFDDLIIGATGVDENGSGAGAAYIVFGKASGFGANLGLAGLDGTNGFRLEGVAAGDWAGMSVSGAGDVNGDGFDDVIVGARNADANGADSGASYVVFGKASGFAASTDLSSLSGTDGFRLEGVAAGDWAGISVSGAGDVNGDGFDDVIVGAYHADPNGADSGSSYVVFGKAGGFVASTNLSTLDGTNGFRLDGVAASDLAGGVSNVGDVNGDGFDDVIIGARYADHGGSNSGSAYVVFGKAGGFSATMDLSTLNGANGFRLDGEAAGDAIGTGLLNAGVGDINGDGFDDVIVGAFGADINGSNSGSAYVVFGQASGFSANMNLSTLDGTNGFRLDGVADGDRAGLSVSSAGDFNGDGFDDVIIGAYRADPNDSNSGSSYLVFGKAGGFDATIDLGALDPTDGFILEGVAAGDQSGRSVSSAGDLNGDGFDDLIVGASYNDTNGVQSGTSYVVFGRAGGLTDSLPLQVLDGGNGFRLDGEAAGDLAGGVSDAGDVNGDGFADVIIGARSTDHGASNAGSAYVVFGKAGGFDASANLSTLDGTNGFRLDGVAAGDSLGTRWAVSSAGDMNGDGFDDVIVGAFGADINGVDSGAAYVVFGKATGFSASMSVSALDGSNGFRLEGVAADDRLLSVSSAGDINGDGFDDVIVGGYRADANGVQSGASYVVFGKAGGFTSTMNLNTLDGTNGFRLEGVAASDRAGRSVSSLGDLNGDGFDDLIVGAAYTDTSGANSGSAYVVYGKASGFSATTNLNTLNGTDGFRIDGVAAGDFAGGLVSSAGDVNNDGFADLIIGATGVDQNASGAGAAYVVFGKAGGFGSSLNLSTLDGSNGFRLAGDAADDWAGFNVSNAGDVNGDGFDDVVVGAVQADPNGASSGASYVVFGKADGFAASTNLSTLDGISGFRLEGVAAGDEAGWASAAGDVNGDGFDDLIIGAYRADNNGADSGSSYVLFGSNFQTDDSSVALIGNVLANDMDPDGDTLTVTAVDALSAKGAAVAIASNGTFTYNPIGVAVLQDLNAGESIVDTFTYTVSDGKGGTSTATVAVTVNGLNNTSPIAVGDNAGASVIDLGDLDGTDGFSIEGVASNDYSGGSVSSAGDVNGDGFDDLIIGATGVDENGSGAGAAYIVFGKASGFGANLGLAGLDGTNGFRLEGVAAGDWAGMSVSGAGDVNGDGFDDVIVGARNADANGADSGASYVVFGKASGFAASTDLSSLSGTDGFRLEGVAAGDWAGISVSGAGDVNGDGFDDVIVGAYHADPNGADSGSSYVVFGKAGGFVASTNLSTLDGTNGFRLDGVAASDLAGGVSNVGDVNGDGFDDVIIGARYADHGGSNSGSAYVVFGKAGGFSATMDLSTLNGANGFRLDGEAAGDAIGTGLLNAGVGDINGDGFDDVIVGAFGADINGSNSGSAYVVFGQASGFSANMNLSTLDGTNGFRLDGVADGDRAGLSVSSAGDFNGDGFDDVIIGAYRADPNDSNSGSSYLVFGKAGGFDATIDLGALDPTDGFILEGVAAGDQSGRSVSSAGDLNGDGFDDLIVGASYNDTNGVQSGTSYVVFGRAGGLTDSLPLQVLDGGNGFRLDGEAAGDLAGGVSDAGDVNGDGFADVIIGARSTDHGASNAGSAYVVFGKAGGFDASANLSTLDGTNGFRLDGVAAGDSLGTRWAVSSAGDMNGDGFDDVIVGAFGADINGVDSGAAYVVFGKATGFSASMSVSALDGSNGFRLEGVAADDRLLSVSSAGDINGDGFDDVIVGGYRADANGVQSGASYVVFGKAGGFTSTMNLNTLDGTNGFRLEGVAASDRAGRSVSSLGDLNGDGFDDLIVGAAYTDTSGANSGSAYVVYGKASGFSATTNLNTLNGTDGFRIDGVAAGDFAGGLVSSAGDVNNDGFADLIIGATGVDQNASGAGAAYVVFGKAGGFGSSLNLSTLDGSNGFRLAGDAADDWAGFNVSNAGDVNGDGFDDVVVGAVQADPNGASSGASYVVFGKADGFAASTNLSTLDGISGFRLEGVAAGDEAGWASAAGDVNGDGFDDLIIGAYRADNNGADSGSSYVLFGSNYVANEDTAALIGNVLVNDTDPDGDTLTVTAVDALSAKGAAVAIASNGTFTYNPTAAVALQALNAGESIVDTFTYTVSDGKGGTSTATVAVTVTGLNDVPVATDDLGVTDEDTVLSVLAASGVLSNDTDADAGDVISVTEVNGNAASVGAQIVLASGALLTLSADGSYVYNPNGQFEGLAVGESTTDTFTYTVSDTNATTDTATVTITINGVNDAPVAADDVGSTNEDTSTLIGSILANDTDPDTTDVLTTTAVDAVSAQGAAVSISSNGVFAYDPTGAAALQALAVGESVMDTFTYTVSDGNGGTDTATVTVTVSGVNDAPVGTDDVGVTDEDTVLNVLAASGVLINDSDVDASDTLTVAEMNGSAGAIGVPTALASGALLTMAADGSYVYDPNGQFESLAAGASTTDSFTYTVSDGNGGTDTLTATITINGVNDAPIGTDDVGVTNEDTVLNVLAAAGVLTNDSDVDAGDTLAVTEMNGSAGAIGVPTALASGALLTLNADGSYAYNPNGQFESLAAGTSTTDSFTYTVSDGNGGTDTATATITINGVNDAPVGTDDTGTTDEDALLNVLAASGVLINDSDVDAGDILTVTEMNGSGAAIGVPTALASGALLTLNADGSYAYNPNGQFESLAVGESTTDSFTYTVSDGNGGTDTLTATITINGVNDAPVSTDDVAATIEDTAILIGSILANDTDPDTTDVLTTTAVDAVSAQGAAVSISSNGVFAYDPTGAAALQALAVGESVMDTFTYTVSDGNGGTDTATVTVTVSGVNDAPVGAGDTGTTDENTVLNVLAASGVLINDSDVDASDALTVTEMNGSAVAIGVPTALASGALLTMAADGSYVYDPNGQFESFAVGASTTDTFTYTVSDGNGGTDTATATITINGVNDAPVGTDDTGTTNEDTVLNVLTASGILVNDSDVDIGDALTVTEMNGSGAAIGVPTALASGALLTLNADGSYAYNPNGQFESLAVGASTTDTFTYTVSDGNGGTDTLTATITINGVNDAPVGTDDTGTTDEDALLNVLAASGVLINDSDVDAGDILTVTEMNGSGAAIGAPTALASGALLTLNADGSYAYNPNGQFESLAAGTSTTDSFTYTVSDGNGGSDTLTATITINGMNDAPTVSVGLANQSAEDGQSFSFIVPGSTFVDVDAGDSLTLSATKGDGTALPAWLMFDAVTGTFSGTPANGDVGLVSIKVTATDGSAATAESSFDLTIDPPSGDDLLDGVILDGVINGGPGNDTITYETASAAVAVNLTTGVGAGAEALGDTYLNIENVIGSAHNDTITGDATNNILDGGAGNDSLLGQDGADNLRGGAGADTLDGGAGSDWANYSGSSAGVTVNLATGTASGGDATGDVLTSIEYLWGSSYNDTLTGDAGVNYLAGADGNDYLLGNAGNDTLVGGDGNDTLRGGAGADVLDGGAGIDIAHYDFSTAGGVTIDLVAGTGVGGDAQGDTFTGIESLVGTNYADSLTGDANGNTLWGYAGDDIISSGAGNDSIVGGDGNDTISGGDGADALRGSAGDDSLDGGAGDDTAYYDWATAAVTVSLLTGTATGEGTDTLTNIENVVGSAFDDLIYASNSGSVLSGGDGNDNLVAGDGADAIDGGSGLDWANYSTSTSAVTVNLATGVHSGGYATGDTLTGAEWVYGSAFDDVLTGDAGANTLAGGSAGNDILDGGAGNDSLLGQDGADNLRGGAGADTLDGGAGSDWANYSGSSAGVTVNLATGTASGGDATGDVLTSIEYLWGSSHNDTLTGDAGVNYLAGADGNDYLLGNAGNDTLVGGDGNDTLRGGAGADVLDGGAGIDIAHYDFSTAGGITIDLVAGTGIGGDAQGDTFTGIESLVGTNYADSLTGDANGNTLWGYAGDDIISSGAGNDSIVGGDGNDTISGGDGADALRGSAGDDSLDGGAGDDTAYYDWATAAVTVSLLTGTATGEGTDTLTNIENVVGSAFDDVLTGNAGANTLVGGDGNDILDGGAGNDTLTGGAGNDQFIFVDNSGADTITDFVAGAATDDVIDFSGASLLNNFADVQAASSQVGLDTLIDMGNGDTVTLEGVSMANLHQDDFQFV